MAKRSADNSLSGHDKEAKRLRSMVDLSKKVLDTVPIVQWRLQVHRWEWLVDTTDQNMAITQRGIERMQGSLATHLDNQRGKLLALVQETLNLMDETVRLLSQGTIDDEIKAMETFIAKHGPPAHQRTASELQVVDTKVVYYARSKDASTAVDRDELLAEKMRAAQGIAHVDGKALDVSDVLALTTDLVERARGLKDIILEFQDLSVDPKQLFPIQTKSQLKRVCRALRRKNYAQLWQSASCSACLEPKLETFQCNNADCPHYLCSECFATAVFKNAEGKFQDPEKLQQVARLSCFYCFAGTMPSDICRALPACDFDIFLHAVEVEAQSEKAKDAACEQTRDAQRFRALPSSAEKMFKLEQDIIAELITIKCPSCSAPFGAFDACCSLTCTRCGAVFCALCLGGPFESDDVAHAHVAACEQRPDAMTDLFLDLEAWKSHMERRQQRQIREYLDATDHPVEMKTRLLDFFAPL